MNYVAVSDNFKKSTVRVIGSLFLFVVIYIALICCAVALTIVLGLSGYYLIAFKFSGITAALAFALVCIGILILIFLIKFIVKKHETDLTHLKELKKADEPQLFEMIEEIVTEIQTDFPKKVYLSSDVNASVFYDSSFWSMFFPIRKNLQIGLGLVNTVSVAELRAILSHEFGHFSQRTMKVGSYVYNMNRVIYNMLYDNESYEEITKKWAAASSYLAISVGLATTVVVGIQWVLRKVHQILNVNYMTLSREMEFHADEIAANVTGSAPLISSLLRLDLADQSYQTVVNYYQEKIEEPEVTQNIYPQQESIMKFFAENGKLPYHHDLPQVGLDYRNRYNKSKLIITNQWASHPTIEERVQRLSELNLPTRNDDYTSAFSIFKNVDILQNEMTKKLFASIQHPPTGNQKSNEEFIQEFKKKHEQNSFDEIFNTYYDSKNPSTFDPESIEIAGRSVARNPEILFGNHIVEKIYEYISTENDISVLQYIQAGNSDIKSFDYDGVKYNTHQCSEVLTQLEIEKKLLYEVIQKNDIEIYLALIQYTDNESDRNKIKSLYQNYFLVDSLVQQGFQVSQEIVQASNFIFDTTPFEIIKQKMQTLKEIEERFKAQIVLCVNTPLFFANLTNNKTEAFNAYLSDNYPYFYETDYKSEELDLLFGAIGEYRSMMVEAHFNAKKQLLDFQAMLFR